MSELEINGIQLSLIGPRTLPLSAVQPGNPNYDAQKGFFTISMKNGSDSDKQIPFDEISRNTVMIYRNPATEKEILDNRVPPPKEEGIVEKFSPGEIKSYQVVFAYPESLAQYENKVAQLQFCVKWDNKWLRVSTYPSNAFDWNESFELCRNIEITDDINQEE